ncbi:MAG: LysE family transporter [Microbacteriaceae bacterium]|jgi:L-lysine exporter family protein LysE/ArgO|nr:LysE family transporter [Microbacteriaceae bacterium]MCI1207356.1 LysE family transporter [Microbacteriaceae bacterium]
MNFQVLLPALFAGLLTQSSLIVAVGAQNAYVLRQGIARVHVPIVVSVCVLSDMLLISAGAWGMGAVIRSAPWITTTMKWFGAVFLSAYAALAAKRACSRHGHVMEGGAAQPGRRQVFFRVLGFTWLNPHVYLDTVVLLGSIGAGYGSGQWAFSAGAILCSVVWFTLIGFGARVLHPLFTTRTAWRILDGLIALTMFGIAAGLVLSAK